MNLGALILVLAGAMAHALGLSFRSLLLPVALRDVPGLKAQWHSSHSCIVAVGILSPLAYTLILYAMIRAPLRDVAPIRELSMMIVALLGAKLLKEDDAHWGLIGSALMATGVVVLTFS